MRTADGWKDRIDEAVIFFFFFAILHMSLKTRILAQVVRRNGGFRTKEKVILHFQGQQSTEISQVI
jgi:hypothetical protein